MSRPIQVRGGGFSAQALSTEADDSTREGAALLLSSPVSRWAVSAVTESSTGVDLVLRGVATTDQGAPVAQILTVTAATSGITAWSTAAHAAIQVRLDVDSVSSSGGIDAYVTGAAESCASLSGWGHPRFAMLATDRVQEGAPFDERPGRPV